MTFGGVRTYADDESTIVLAPKSVVELRRPNGGEPDGEDEVQHRRVLFGKTHLERTASLSGVAAIAVTRDAIRIHQHPCHVQQVPGHDGRVALGEVIVKSGAGTVLELVAMRWPWTSLTAPAAEGLWGYGEPEVRSGSASR